MSERNCSTPAGQRGFCKTEQGISGCSLYQSLNHQSEHGGSPTKEQVTSKARLGGTGRYWTKEKWDSFMEKLKNEAANGCPFASQILENITSVTSRKKASGDFV